jgi:pyrroline-5-carboxylate reductase
MLDRERSLCILGCGTMGEAIVGGLHHAGWLDASRLIATTRRPKIAKSLSERLAITTTTDNLTACREAEVILLCLKPQRFAEVIDDDDMRDALAGKLVISIAAGITLATLEGWLPKSAVVRAMPNTPALIGQGMTIVSRGHAVSDDQISLVHRIFESVGRCMELESKHMDAVTSLNGSGPAFAYVMLEAMADGGVMMGLPRDVALTIAAQVFQGAAAMVLDTSSHPAALKDQVTTPAGCTIAGLLTMEDGRIRSVLARTIQEATNVAGQLGREEGTTSR